MFHKYRWLVNTFSFPSNFQNFLFPFFKEYLFLLSVESAHRESISQQMFQEQGETLTGPHNSGNR